MDKRIRWLKEPLVHFLAIGALVFLVFHMWGSGGPGNNRIVITSGQIDSMIARFTRTWQRPPTDQELKGLIDDYIREEMATREATTMGLDRGDTVIRRRLRQKLEFMAEDVVDAGSPTDAELKEWLNEHPDDYRILPELAFFQVYLNPDKRGASIREDADRILQQLASARLPEDASTMGDSLMLPYAVNLTSLPGISRIFGREFADAILYLEPGQWSGPVPSGYGLHLVYIRERKDGRVPALGEVRTNVERDILNARRKDALNAMYENMLERYKVTMEKRESEAGIANAATGPAKGDTQ